jgi:hypothetical protein
MPRLPSIELAVFGDLLAQQRYTPRAALLGQVRRIEAFAPELAVDESYPADYLVFRVTGYRPAAGGEEAVRGSAALADLSALAERLCDLADASSADLPGGSVGIAELASAWGVSRRTVERFRRAGLIAWRVRGVGGRRLAFTPGVVEAFAGRRGAAGAGRARRLTEPEREAVRARAGALGRERGGLSIGAASAAIAAETGRSANAVRRVLEGGGAAPRGVSSRWRKTPAWRRRAIARALGWGAAPGVVSARYGVSRATATRIWVERRAGALAAHARGLPRAEPREEVEVDASVRASEVEPEIDARALAGAQRALLIRARSSIEAASDGGRGGARLVDSAETDLRRALRLRAALVEGERGLMLRTIEQWLGRPLLSLDAERVALAIGVAYGAASRAVAGGPRLRGGRVAAPVSVALMRALAELGRSESWAGPTPIGEGRALSGARLADFRAGLAPWAWIVRPHFGLARGAAALPPADAALVRMRFGLGSAGAGEDWPMAVDEVAAAAGVGRTRVIGAWRRARRALVREALGG